MDVQSDGLDFDPTSIQATRIIKQADFVGIRIKLQGKLGVAKIFLQIDIGFDDVLFPQPQVEDLPTILDFPAPRMLCYKRESSIAEKFHAMVSHELLNNRMKDYFDIWQLSHQFDFEGSSLAKAITSTFQQRGTELPLEIKALSEQYANDKQDQWLIFHSKIYDDSIPDSLSQVVTSVSEFLLPVVEALNSGESFTKKWTASDSWN